jgi:DNA-binding NarL/FixJ family response regulator
VSVLSRHALVRLGLTALVNTHPDRAVVVDTVALDGRLQHVDVAVYDLAGLAENVGDLERLARGRIPVVGLARDERAHLTDGAEALGVRCIVQEHVSSTGLIKALEQAAGRRDARRSADSPSALTDREFTVLRLIATGLPNQEIARELYLSINSVKTYIRSAYKKIGVKTRAQAVIWAIHNGLAPLGGGLDWAQAESQAALRSGSDGAVVDGDLSRSRSTRTTRTGTRAGGPAASQIADRGAEVR